DLGRRGQGGREGLHPHPVGKRRRVEPALDPLIWLDEIGEADRARVGGKAYVLARLRRAGVRVPDGFVLTPDEAVDGEGAAALRSAAARLGGTSAVRSS